MVVIVPASLGSASRQGGVGVVREAALFKIGARRRLTTFDFRTGRPTMSQNTPAFSPTLTTSSAGRRTLFDTRGMLEDFQRGLGPM